MKLSVIIPAYNEAGTILNVIEQVRHCGVSDLEILVVNDCSTDGTTEILNSLPPSSDLRIFTHEVNRGKGAGIRTAQEHITGDAVIIQDADLEYSPTEFPKMLELIESGKADAVFGSRYSGSVLRIDTFVHFMGNRMLTNFSNVCSNLHLSDMETCYKMIRVDIFKKLHLECSRFGFEPEVTAKLSRLKASIYEVPIAYTARPYDAGKKIGWKDGVAAMWYIMKYNWFSRGI